MENQENEILYAGWGAKEIFVAADFSKSQMEDESLAK